MTTLLIARHGNTFAPGEVPRRVGKNTDLPLVDSGLAQAKDLAEYLTEHKLLPDVIYCSQLQRTQQTARSIMALMQKKIPMIIRGVFDEIDYGIDENKTEAQLIERIGEPAINAWNKDSIVPDGWDVKPQRIRQQWTDFAEEIVEGRYAGGRIMVVTSNGIARFAPCLLDDEAAFDATYSRKIATGAVCQMEHLDGKWSVQKWDVK